MSWRVPPSVPQQVLPRGLCLILPEGEALFGALPGALPISWALLGALSGALLGVPKFEKALRKHSPEHIRGQNDGQMRTKRYPKSNWDEGSLIFKNIFRRRKFSTKSCSDRNFLETPRFVDIRTFGSWMSAPTCLFFQGFEGSDESFDPGYLWE